MQEIVERYLAAWNEKDVQRRRELVDALWTENGSYTDPLADANGRAEIDGLIGAVQQQFPDFVFTLGGPVDAHHEQARFTWHLGPEGAAEPIVVGFDVAVLNGGGQIRSVYGFLDKVPAARGAFSRRRGGGGTGAGLAGLAAGAEEAVGDGFL